MAMGAAKGEEATRQVEMLCLDELVPEDDRYRRIDRFVDWGFVREAAASYYADGLGRPSVDPVVLMKLVLVGALEGIGSVRELLRVASMRLDLRRFLGYGLGERLPVHQTVSDAHSRRFVDATLFERLFARTVALCGEHDLLDGTHLSVDGFHVEANAALASLRASLEPLRCEGGPPSETEPEPGAPRLSLCEPRSGPAPKRRSSNATSRSVSDPDARLRGKPGQRPHLVYRAQVAVDPKARCVVACLGERADGFEGDGLAALLDRARFHCPELASVGADQGYAAERVWRDCEHRQIVAYIPPQRTMLPPAGEKPRTNAERAALAARQRAKSDEGIWAHARRMADAEGIASEAKLHHALDRARCRGEPAFHIQVLLTSTAINLKRLTTHVPEAAGSVAAMTIEDGARVEAIGGACAQQTDPARPAGNPTIDASLCRLPLVWTLTLCLN